MTPLSVPETVFVQYRCFQATIEFACELLGLVEFRNGSPCPPRNRGHPRNQAIDLARPTPRSFSNPQLDVVESISKGKYRNRAPLGLSMKREIWKTEISSFSDARWRCVACIDGILYRSLLRGIFEGLEIEKDF